MIDSQVYFNEDLNGQSSTASPSVFSVDIVTVQGDNINDIIPLEGVHGN